VRCAGGPSSTGLPSHKVHPGSRTPRRCRRTGSWSRRRGSSCTPGPRRCTASRRRAAPQGKARRPRRAIPSPAARRRLRRRSPESSRRCRRDRRRIRWRRCTSRPGRKSRSIPRRRSMVSRSPQTRDKAAAVAASTAGRCTATCRRRSCTSRRNPEGRHRRSRSSGTWNRTSQGPGVRRGRRGRRRCHRRIPTRHRRRSRARTRPARDTRTTSRTPGAARSSAPRCSRPSRCSTTFHWRRRCWSPSYFRIRSTSPLRSCRRRSTLRFHWSFLRCWRRPLRRSPGTRWSGLHSPRQERGVLQGRERKGASPGPEKRSTCQRAAQVISVLAGAEPVSTWVTFANRVAVRYVASRSRSARSRSSSRRRTSTFSRSTTTRPGALPRGLRR
jgi:hypothetical protein